MTEIRPLSARNCPGLLATQDVGRPAFSEHAMPAIRPVDFSLDDGDVVIRTGPDGSMGRLTGEVVAFEVDHIDSRSRTGWSVSVLREVQPVTGIDELVRLADPGRRPWPAGDRSRFLRIPVTSSAPGRCSCRRRPPSPAEPMPGLIAGFEEGRYFTTD